MTPQELSTLCRHPRLTEIESIAESCVGVPWKPGAHTMYSMDCVGLVIMIGIALKLYEPGELNIPRYNSLPTAGSMLKAIGTYLKRIPKPIHGGIVTFAQPGTALYHVSIIGDRHMYSAQMSNKKVVKVTLSPACFENQRVCFSFDRPEAPTPRIASPLIQVERA